MTQNKTELIEVVKADKMTKASIELKIGRALANPINAKREGEEFSATLTGEISITKFGERKSAHLLTVEGYKIPVPANFDKSVHKAKAVVKCVCLIATVKDDKGEERKVNYTGLV